MSNNEMLVLVNALEQSEDSALFYQAGPSTSNSTFTSKNTQERALISCVPVFINGKEVVMKKANLTKNKCTNCKNSYVRGMKA